jgi:hypothetical protein
MLAGTEISDLPQFIICHSLRTTGPATIVALLRCSRISTGAAEQLTGRFIPRLGRPFLNLAQ